MKDRTLIALLVAEVVSGTGSALTFIALPWFVLVTSGSAVHMSAVLAVEILPMALFGIPSGMVVSRLGARKTMLLCDLVRAPLIALVPVLHWTGHLTYPLLLVIVFFTGVFIAPYFTSQRTIIPELFGDDEKLTAKASGLLNGAGQVPIIVGPAISGVLIAWVGASPLLVADGVSFVVSFAIVVSLVRGGARVPADESSRGVLAGLRYLLRDPLLGPMLITLVILDGSANAVGAAVPLLAYTRYDRDPHIAGWMFAGFGIGAIVGSILVMKLIDRFRPLVLTCIGILGIALPLWTGVAHVQWFVLCAAIVLSGFFVPLANAPMMGIITTRPPVAVRAKVMTAVMTASGLGGPGVRLLVGPVFRAWGNAGVWVMIAGGVTLGALLFVVLAIWRGSTLEAPQATPTIA